MQSLFSSLSRCKPFVFPQLENCADWKTRRLLYLHPRWNPDFISIVSQILHVACFTDRPIGSKIAFDFGVLTRLGTIIINKPWCPINFEHFLKNKKDKMTEGKWDVHKITAQLTIFDLTVYCLILDDASRLVSRSGSPRHWLASHKYWPDLRKIFYVLEILRASLSLYQWPNIIDHLRKERFILIH